MFHARIARNWILPNCSFLVRITAEPTRLVAFGMRGFTAGYAHANEQNRR